VFCSNDDITPRPGDFVVWVLRTVFHKARSEAFTVMLNVHQTGLGVAGIYTHDVARPSSRPRAIWPNNTSSAPGTMEPEAVTN